MEEVVLGRARVPNLEEVGLAAPKDRADDPSGRGGRVHRVGDAGVHLVRGAVRARKVLVRRVVEEKEGVVFGRGEVCPQAGQVAGNPGGVLRRGLLGGRRVLQGDRFFALVRFAVVVVVVTEVRLGDRDRVGPP